MTIDRFLYLGRCFARGHNIYIYQLNPTENKLSSSLSKYIPTADHDGQSGLLDAQISDYCSNKGLTNRIQMNNVPDGCLSFNTNHF